MSQSKSDNRKPLLTNGDNSHPDSSRSTSVDIGRRDKDVTDGPVVPAPPAGCAARMHAYKACLFVMCTMTGVSIVYGGFSAVVAVFLHEQLGLPERWATFAVNMFGYVCAPVMVVPLPRCTRPHTACPPAGPRCTSAICPCSMCGQVLLNW